MTRVRHVVVAVPARDEELVLGACLESVRAAVDRLAEDRPGTGVSVVVALDRCTDASAAVAARHPVTVVHLASGSVGAARRAAVAAGLDRARRDGAPWTATWVAVTDADTVVPVHWLTGQLALAEAGADLVVGTVEPDPTVPAGLLAAWHARHELRDGHPHVHGANLGVRADAYRQVGGFAPLPVHEDVALVAAVRDAGRASVATDAIRVVTSSRALGRVGDGFAAYLAELDASGRAAGGLAPTG